VFELKSDDAGARRWARTTKALLGFAAVCVLASLYTHGACSSILWSMVACIFLLTAWHVEQAYRRSPRTRPEEGRGDREPDAAEARAGLDSETPDDGSVNEGPVSQVSATTPVAVVLGAVALSLVGLLGLSIVLIGTQGAHTYADALGGAVVGAGWFAFCLLAAALLIKQSGK
jgi:hypothetical protein